ncbi:uncharacterized protein LOC111601757 [Drosophila hydei]|uniref:Uncharacterized protein LOC111601757 n=1 Tax=Drosophila hydei TaxID=7224 RepID=A0A6J1M0I6_DROHY|nr:uncharacterized protein LOC111601757 [Drosophila hydei]
MSQYRLLLQLPRLLLLLLVAAHPLTAEPAGYHYDRPTAGPYAPTAPSSILTGHHFSPLPTVQPLPPVPALPPLPTGHGPLPRTRIQQPALSLATRYLPATPAAPVVSSYSAPDYAAPLSSISFHGHVTPTQQSLPIHVPSAPAAAQPLRIPFGKQALFSPGESYVANGRQLKQYAVIEIIDNDINESPAPFLSSGFLDRYRASLGASGTGATPTSTGAGLQLDSRANALVLEQQALSLQPRAGQSDAIALGSGGLGYIRLPNGNVYLGSGSLGYISGQQRVASVLDARTRSESTSDALHFGHGPYGGADNFLRF